MRKIYKIAITELRYSVLFPGGMVDPGDFHRSGSYVLHGFNRYHVDTTVFPSVMVQYRTRAFYTKFQPLPDDAWQPLPLHPFIDDGVDESGVQQRFHKIIIFVTGFDDSNRFG